MDNTPLISKFGYALVKLSNAGHATRPAIRYVLENYHIRHMQFE